MPYFRKISMGGIVLLSIISSYGLDTTEPFDIGFTDFEMVGGFGGVGLGRGEKELSWEGVIGVGITESFAASFAYGLSSNEFLAGSGNDEFSMILYLNPVSSKFFQLDFLTSMSSGGSLDVGTEINLDAAYGGFQLTANETFSNREDLDHSEPSDKINYHTCFAPLLYYNLTESMQLLTGIDFTLHHSAGAGADRFEIGSYAIGYNFALNDAIELVTEFSMDIPGSGEQFSSGFSVQFISTLPVGK